MAKEIERKFLVNTEVWKPVGEGIPYVQGYISSNSQRAVRVRVAGRKGFLSVKSLAADFTMHDFEYEIPFDDAEAMLELYCKKPHVAKTRHRETHHGKLWEIDVFHLDNDGLVVAEVELESEEEEITLPQFVIREVTSDQRYLNASLHKVPFKEWR
jgi:CYTH domain-containing protein